MNEQKLGKCDQRKPNDPKEFFKTGALYSSTVPIFGICNLLLQEYLGEVPAVCQFIGSKENCSVPRMIAEVRARQASTKQ